MRSLLLAISFGLALGRHRDVCVEKGPIQEECLRRCGDFSKPDLVCHEDLDERTGRRRPTCKCGQLGRPNYSLDDNGRGPEDRDAAAVLLMDPEAVELYLQAMAKLEDFKEALAEAHPDAPDDPKEIMDRLGANEAAIELAYSDISSLAESFAESFGIRESAHGAEAVDDVAALDRTFTDPKLKRLNGDIMNLLGAYIRVFRSVHPDAKIPNLDNRVGDKVEQIKEAKDELKEEGKRIVYGDMMKLMDDFMEMFGLQE